MEGVLKYFYLLLTLLIINCGLAYPQSGWVRQYPPPQAMNTSFLGVSFFNRDTGFIVGGYGTILHTTNGGIDWNIQTSGTTNWLRGVSASGPETATAVGDSGTILHTTNGGAVWKLQSSGIVHNLRALSFIDKDKGIVVGDSGTILYTTNGGTTWLPQSSKTLYNLNSVSFIDSSNGMAVGNSGIILRTKNGGTTWTSQSIGQDYQLLGVSLTDADTGIVVGNYHGCLIDPCPDNGPVILRIANDSVLWKAKIPDSLFLICKICTPDVIAGVSFIDVNTGTVVIYNCIFHTTNGGGVLFSDSSNSGGGYWTLQLADTTNIYQGVCFTDANNGTVVGAYGIILHTTNGGVTDIKDNLVRVPTKFILDQNYPNPFNPSTTINYQIPPNGVLGTNNSFVTLKIYDILGREVKTLVNGYQQQGKYSVNFNADNLASGIYFYRLSSGSFTSIKKMVLLK